jgi:hypothetical protein
MPDQTGATGAGGTGDPGPSSDVQRVLHSLGVGPEVPVGDTRTSVGPNQMFDPTLIAGLAAGGAAATARPEDEARRQRRGRGAGSDDADNDDDQEGRPT